MVERGNKVSCEDNVVIFIDNEILFRQFLTENGFKNVSF